MKYEIINMNNMNYELIIYKLLFQIFIMILPQNIHIIHIIHGHHYFHHIILSIL